MLTDSVKGSVSPRCSSGSSFVINALEVGVMTFSQGLGFNVQLFADLGSGHSSCVFAFRSFPGSGKLNSLL